MGKGAVQRKSPRSQNQSTTTTNLTPKSVCKNARKWHGGFLIFFFLSLPSQSLFPMGNNVIHTGMGSHIYGIGIQRHTLQQQQQHLFDVACNISEACLPFVPLLWSGIYTEPLRARRQDLSGSKAKRTAHWHWTFRNGEPWRREGLVPGHECREESPRLPLHPS